MKREYPEHPIVAVAATVFNANNCVLLVRRAKNPGKGMWGIPGGAVEPGEKLASAVKRELLEETGIVADPIKMITFLERVYRDKADRVQYHFIIFEYLCRVDDATPKASDDVDKAIWVNLENIKTFPVPDITRKVIEQGWNLLQSLER